MEPKWEFKTTASFFSDADLDAMRKENDELKKALGEAHLDIKILKKVRTGCPKASREDIQDYARGFEVSQNRILRLFGISKGTAYYKKRGSDSS